MNKFFLWFGMHLDDNNYKTANFILLTANLKLFHWNEMLNWWLPDCITWPTCISNTLFFELSNNDVLNFVTINVFLCLTLNIKHLLYKVLTTLNGA